MDPLAAALVAFLIGVVLTGAAAYLLHQQRARTQDSDVPLLSPGVRETIDLVRSAALAIGPHDEILHSTPQARTIGMARGNRVGVVDLLEVVRRVRRQNQPETFDLDVRRGPGLPARHLTVRLAPIDLGVVLLVAEDRSAAVRVDESKRDFVANVSHELKTPVGAITVLSEAIREAADDPAAVVHFADRLCGESVRLGELVGQIIELSRLQSDDPLGRAEPVDVDQIAREALSYCRPQAEARGVTLVAACTAGLQVTGDAAQLSSAIMNLVQNAIVYSDPGARVAVSTSLVEESDDHFVEIMVADNGIGMNPDELERIFERFYRVDYARSRASGGTGLGLSIVKHIVAVHGGTVDVWSRVGAGSTFTIRLQALLDEQGHPDPGASWYRNQPDDKLSLNEAVGVSRAGTDEVKPNGANTDH